VTWLLLKKYALPALLALAVSALTVSHWWAYRSGVQAESTRQEARIAQVREAARVRQEALADELEQARAHRQIVVRDRIRFVDRVVDPAGCADVVVPDGLLEALGGAHADD
jgi:predicted phage tail protein